MSKINRPLSPHLFIYSFQLTSFLSICHRISGTVLVLFISLIMILENLDTFSSEFFIFYNYLYLFDIYFYWFLISFFYFISGSLSFHMLNGIRHLLWDLKYGLEIKNVIISGLFILTIISLYIFLLIF
jgi:succinate dehydrogenase / fumarate reductase cytochrome b subunit